MFIKTQILNDEIWNETESHYQNYNFSFYFILFYFVLFCFVLFFMIEQIDYEIFGDGKSNGNIK